LNEGDVIGFLQQMATQGRVDAEIVDTAQTWLPEAMAAACP
jgi:hypothetical protein